MDSQPNVADLSPLTPLARQLRLSATLEINERVKERHEAGKPVAHLGFGEANFPVHRDVLAAHRQATEQTSYLPVAGLPKLRESVARFQSRRLGCTIAAEQVVIAPGSKPLLFALFDILHGDAMIPRPSWVSYEPQILHAGKKLFWVETDPEDRHCITAVALQDSYDKAVAAGGNPRIMLINSPSNPTGRAFSDSAVEVIATFCRENDICLISDEIYSDIGFGEQAPSSACARDRFVAGPMVLTGGLSKTHSAGGWRVGFAIFPQSDFGSTVQQAILAYASECWSAASAPAQEAAAVAFGCTPVLDLYRRQVVLLHRGCTFCLYEALRDCGLAVAQPQGAFYVYPSFHPLTEQLEAMGIVTSLQLSRWLIDECGVAALPGSAFGEDDQGPKTGRYRLRMATSGLFFRNQRERYEQGYQMLEGAEEKASTVALPLLDEAVAAIRKAVQKIRDVQ